MAKGISTGGAAGAAAVGALGSLASGLVNTVGGLAQEDIRGTYNLVNTLAQNASQFQNNTAASAIQGIMGHNANLQSAASQAAQGEFNQGSANLANAIDSGRLTEQAAFNSAQANAANEFTSMMWDKTAAWNEMMWDKQAEFNRVEAEKARQWQEKMSNTQYQRTMKDMAAAGLNPILAYSNGGAGVPGGASAAVGGAQMSSAQGQMASAGLLGANAASEGNYQGQMEFTGGVLNLLSQALNGIGTAQMAMSAFGQGGLEFLSNITNLFKEQKQNVQETLDYAEKNKSKPGDFNQGKSNRRNGADIYKG